MSETYTSRNASRHDEVDELYRQVRRAISPQSDGGIAVSPGNPGAPRSGDGRGEKRGEGPEYAPVSATFHELARGVEMCSLYTPTLPPATHTNCYLLGEDEVIVVDPASPYEPVQRGLAELLSEHVAAGRRIVSIWLTHHHGDHVGGARALAAEFSVPIAAHRRTAELLAGHIDVDETIADGTVRALSGAGGRRVRAIHTPGHAPGHLCFLEETTGHLVAGDMVAGIGTILVEPKDGDMAAYLASLERMKTLQPAALLPAHGPVIRDAVAKLNAYIAHRLWREERVLAALSPRDGKGLEELVTEVYEDVPAAVHVLAMCSLEAHLIKLVEEQRAQRVSGDRDTWLAM